MAATLRDFEVRFACGRQRFVVADDAPAVTKANGYECGHGPARITSGHDPHAIIAVRPVDS